MKGYQSVLLCFNVMSAAASAMMTTHEARVSEITGGGYSLNDLNTAHKSASSLVHHRRKLPPIRSPTSRVPAIFPPGGPMSKEDLTINYGILGGQFHFEKPGAVGPGGHNSGSKYGCYGQPNRETTYYSANAVNGYQTLTRGQFERVAHLFPLSCGGNLILQRRTAKLLADNQRMAKSIQTKLGQQRNGAGQERALQPTMVLLVPFCPNSDNEALTFLHQWRQHATPVNVAGYLFNSQTQATSASASSASQPRIRTERETTDP